MGDDLRYKSAIGNTLSELAILLRAREWTQDYEWSVHYPIALKAGIKQGVADAIADGRRPILGPDEEIVYDYSVELLKDKQVSNSTFEGARTRFGAQGVVDLTRILGYYTFLPCSSMRRSTRPPPMSRTMRPTPTKEQSHDGI